VVIHAAPTRTPPGISVEGQFTAMLIAGQPGLSVGMAETIARVKLEADKGGLGGRNFLYRAPISPELNVNNSARPSGVAPIKFVKPLRYQTPR